MLDINKMQLREVALVEELSGQAFDQFENGPKGKALAALALIAKRRELAAEGLPANGFKFEDALSLTTDEAAALVFGAPADDEADAPLATTE